jgi:hypothetical protein
MRTGRPRRPSGLAQFVSGTFDVSSSDPGWQPAEDHDVAAVAIAYLQHRLFNILHSRHGATLVTVAAALGKDVRNVRPLWTGAVAMQMEQVLALMLAYDLDFRELGRATARGGEALLPSEYEAWLVRGEPGHVPTLRRPDTEPHWQEAATRVADALSRRELDRRDRLIDDGVVLMDLVDALSSNKAFRPALADRMPAHIGATIAYAAPTGMELDAHCILDSVPLQSSSIAALVLALLRKTPGRRHVSVLALGALNSDRLTEALPVLLTDPTTEATADIDERDLVRLGVTTPPGQELISGSLLLRGATATPAGTRVLMLETLKGVGE